MFGQRKTVITKMKLQLQYEQDSKSIPLLSSAFNSDCEENDNKDFNQSCLTMDLFEQDHVAKFEKMFIASKPDIHKIKGYMLSAVRNDSAKIINFLHTYASKNNLINEGIIEVALPGKILPVNPLEVAIMKNNVNAVKILCTLSYSTVETYELGRQKDKSQALRDIIETLGKPIESEKLDKCCGCSMQ